MVDKRKGRDYLHLPEGIVPYEKKKKTAPRDKLLSKLNYFNYSDCEVIEIKVQRRKQKGEKWKVIQLHWPEGIVQCERQRDIAF